MCGVLPPRLLQDHSPSGEPHYIALANHRNRSGAALVNRSDPSKRLKYKHHSHEKTPLVAGLVIKLRVRRLTAQGSLPGVASTGNPFADSDGGRAKSGDFITNSDDIIATCDEFQLVVSQLLIEQFGVVVVSVESSHGFESELSE